LTPDRLKLYCYNRVEELYAEHKTATTERRELISNSEVIPQLQKHMLR
jgi:hypothetical protein